MPYANVNGLRIYYEEVGSGNAEPILFVHGSFSRGETSFAEQLRYFGEKYRCVAPDLRGHGKTKGAHTPRTNPQMADDLIGLLDALGIETANLVGHSMGADIAMQMAMAYPARVKKIAALSSTGAPTEAVRSFVRRHAPEKLDAIRHKKFIETIKKEHADAHGGEWENFLRFTVENCVTTPPFTDEELRTIAQPFLLIYGGGDKMILPEEVERLRRTVPHYAAHKIENAPHFLQQTNAEETNRVLEEFFNSREK